jgi:hypothetical protein
MCEQKELHNCESFQGIHKFEQTARDLGALVNGKKHIVGVLTKS